jgi:hypothetical protein
MESTYEVITTDKGQVIKRTDPNGSVWWIPMDESNSDYQRYLEEQANDQSL